ncbi:MAG: hypothetical protein HFJ09_06890 [Lachnospiraceae bacterium]|nr:hypothetical protein [Lachnospiraceae bacterium]
MTISSVNNVNGTNWMGNAGNMDSYSKDIQNQIARAQKELQEISANEELSMEDKMKKKQDIQKQIMDLNNELRQHQMEQRRQQQQEKANKMQEALGGKPSDKKTEKNNGNGISDTRIEAMISADTSVKQAKVQSSVSKGLERRAKELQTEIKLDGKRANPEKKQAEIADLTSKSQAAMKASMSSLQEANTTMKETTEKEEAAKNAKTKDTKETEKGQNVNKAEEKKENLVDQIKEKQEEEIEKKVYTPVDICL